MTKYQNLFNFTHVNKTMLIFFLFSILLFSTNCDFNFFQNKNSNAPISDQTLGIKKTDPLILEIREQTNDKEREQKRIDVAKYFDQHPTLDEKTKLAMYNSAFWEKTSLNQNYITKAQLTKLPLTNQFQVEIFFNDKGNEMLKKITKKNIGKNLGIFLDEQLIASPVVNETVADKSAFITGAQSEEQGRILAAQINRAIEKNIKK
jgi:preprotein translocase subunit SecD